MEGEDEELEEEKFIKKNPEGKKGVAQRQMGGDLSRKILFKYRKERGKNVDNPMEGKELKLDEARCWKRPRRVLLYAQKEEMGGDSARLAG